jgi:hypothetical protein
VTIDLACAPADLVAVNVTGACAGDTIKGAEAGVVAGYFHASGSPSILYVVATQVGICHVQLVFATGYTYSADAQITSVPSDVGGCPASTAATPSVLHVSNPAATCRDGGVEASAD